MRRALERHRPADVDVGRLDVLLREAEEGQELEGRIRELLGRDLEDVLQEVVAERPAVEDELDVEGRLQARLDGRELVVGEALGAERPGVDRRRLAHRAVADRVGLDLGDLGFAVAEGAQRVRHRAVDDLEVAAAGELLELHQREVGLDAGGVAIHDQADRAGGRDDGGLGVAVAVLLAERQGAVPGVRRRARRGRPGARWRGRGAPGRSRGTRSPPPRRGRRGGGCGSPGAWRPRSPRRPGRPRVRRPSRRRWRRPRRS